MRRSLHLTVAAIGLLVAASAAMSLQPALIEDAAAAAPDAFLGFDLGEERRYAVGPREALRSGEAITWRVQLDRVEAEEGRRIGVFLLEHEQKRSGLSGAGPIYVHWKYAGEARINEEGFPELVRFTMYEEHSGESQWRGEDMTAEYVFTGGEYQKDVRVPDQQWQFPVPIATHGDLDLDVPSGLYLFRPQARETDFFTNPALLGFALPEIPSDGWERRMLFFQPTFPVRYPDARWASRERDRRAALGRYWSKNTLKLGERARLEIGDRVLNVRKLDISGPLRSAYVDEFGRVVRMDIDPDPWTRKYRHIRLLFPGEY